MSDEHEIIRQVYAAKEDAQAADRLIDAYMPFIRAETAKFLKRPPVEGSDDELSIAMFAFYEAIHGYFRIRGAFLKYASLLIRSRLIDYYRKERKHLRVVSLDTPADGDDAPLGDLLADGRDHGEEMAHREATRREIEELTRQMEAFGVGLPDVADNCPRQERTLNACRKALQYAKEHPELLEQLLLRQLLQQGLHIPVKADVVRHSRSPPNRFRSLCRRRYSRPSAARSVMPSSAAIWAVDWQ